jgi:hypothetical protein
MPLSFWRGESRLKPSIEKGNGAGFATVAVALSAM